MILINLKKEGLPAIENIYSKLTSKNISDCDYNHAENVWKKFECKTMEDYHYFYLKSDILILVDVFENFRKNRSRILLFRSCTLFQLSWFCLERNVKNDRYEGCSKIT